MVFGLFVRVMLVYFVVGLFGVPLYYHLSRGWGLRKCFYEWFKLCNLFSGVMFGTKRVVDDGVVDEGDL